MPKELSEPLHHCLEQQAIRTVFKSDTVNSAKQDGVVCRIPCERDKVYIGETGRPMLERIN